MSGQTESGNVFKLTVLTAAIGAGTMGAAGAATISKAPAGYAPVVFTSNIAASRSFDTDGDGTPDFTISSGSNSSNGSNFILLSAPSPASTFSGFANLYSYSSPDAFVPVTSLKNNGGGGAGDYITSIGSAGSSSMFSPNVPSYAELATNVTYSSNSSIASGLIGYILGTRAVVSGAGTSSEVDTFTVSDFGVIATAVPEPSSLALLAMGGVGVAALRRRQARRRSQHAA